MSAVPQGRRQLRKRLNPSGRVHIQLPPTAAAIIGAIIHGQGANSNASTMLNAKAMLAATLPLRLIAPFSRQARI